MITGGWVHSVSFSASGEKLAWVGHDSSIGIVDAANGQKYEQNCSYIVVWHSVSSELIFEENRSVSNFSVAVLSSVCLSTHI